MIVLKILLVIVAWFSIAYFDRGCLFKFGYCFLNRISSWAIIIAVFCIMGGTAWYNEAIVNHHDTLNGLILIGLGGGIFLLLLYLNFKLTGFVYGLTGSALQLAVAGGMFYFGWVFIIFWCVGTLLWSFQAISNPVSM